MAKPLELTVSLHSGARVFIFIPREETFCWLVWLPSLQPDLSAVPESCVDVLCSVQRAAEDKACRQALQLAPQVPTVGWQWEETVVEDDEKGGEPHAGCTTRDSLSEDTCLSGIISI